MSRIHRQLLATRRGHAVHVREMGAGPAILLLHERPSDGTSLLKIADALATTWRVIVPDLAGHGGSDTPHDRNAGLPMHGNDLEDVLCALGVSVCAVFAQGNAASLAAHLCLRSALTIDRLFLHDPVPWHVGAAADTFAAEPSGAHLIRVWDSVVTRALFAPGTKPSLASRIDRSLPTAGELHAHAVAYLKAARGLMDAADNHELPDGRWLPPGCTTPIVEILSPTLARAPRSGTVSSDTHTLSPDDCPSSVIRSYPVRTVSTATVPRRFERADNQRLSRRLVRLEDGHIHLWISSSGSKRPVVALHDPAGSGHLVLPFVSALADDRPIVVPDLPGNGESDRLLNKGTITSSSYARIVADLIRGLGIDEVDVIGRYSGGPIGMELSYLCPGLVSHLVIAAIAFYDAPPEAPFRDELLARYTPTVLPQEDGSHLLRAWHIMKSQALFWPWYRRDRDGIIKGDPQLDPELINRRVLELAICGDLYRDAYGALWRYPMRERLPTLGVPTLLCAPRWDPLYNDLAIASAAAPRAKVATLPDAPTEWHGKFRAFFDDKLR